MRPLLLLLLACGAPQSRPSDTERAQAKEACQKGALRDCHHAGFLAADELARAGLSDRWTCVCYEPGKAYELWKGFLP